MVLQLKSRDWMVLGVVLCILQGCAHTNQPVGLDSIQSTLRSDTGLRLDGHLAIRSDQATEVFRIRLTKQGSDLDLAVVSNLGATLFHAQLRQGKILIEKQSPAYRLLPPARILRDLALMLFLPEPQQDLLENRVEFYCGDIRITDTFQPETLLLKQREIQLESERIRITHDEFLEFSFKRFPRKIFLENSEYLLQLLIVNVEQSPGTPG